MGLFSYFDKLINERGSANILNQRILLLEQEHAAELRKHKAEQEALSGQLRTVTGERDLARTELEQTKGVLEQARMRMAQMEPLAVQARQMAIHVGFRKAFFGSGFVLVLQNKTTKPMALNVTVTDATGQKTKQFRVVANGGIAAGANFQASSPAEIGHQEGWAFAPGDKVEVACPGFDPIKITVP